MLTKIQNITNCIECDENIVFSDIESEIEAVLKNPHLPTLKNSVETRWNSLLNMIKSFSLNCEVINIVLLKIKKEELLIPAMQGELIKDFADFLEIFAEATTYMQGLEYATTSTAIYFYENIYTTLLQKGENSSFGIILHLHNFAKQNFCKRFNITKLHLVSALMDPCQKNWSNLMKYIKKIPANVGVPDTFVLENEVENYITKENLILQKIKKYGIEINIPEEPPAKKEKISDNRRRMLNFLSDTGDCSSRDIVSIEIQKYFDISVHESLDWWKENQEVFHRIAQLANICFAIPATSSSSEIAFSMAGSCITEKRSRLNQATVKKQLFIHDNFKIFTKD
ncbi:uncharacterized protein LOC124421304 [Lucilia cuprina]|uniref:uncharacterized protein LOC124421304 n=1 Tax=Lucilia cuprina TaxID=7375 RepID=UPI001F05D78A|nr:uncharacterized protein LOC124421304 [Lucilia cuprina]XP_046812220.1 uncharacterized protein LOC124421304 [Lucilia cuprina]